MMAHARGPIPAAPRGTKHVAEANGARIALAERSRELATLRVPGFTRLEISSLLLGEIFVLAIPAVPVGLLIGYRPYDFRGESHVQRAHAYAALGRASDVRVRNRSVPGSCPCFGSGRSATPGRAGFGRGVESKRMT